jgi:GNAT superfamily N-acetyltransferase
MKIGRLGVSNNFKGQGIGTIILDYIKELFITNNRTGCRFITVDAYGASLTFYERNGFGYLTSKDKGMDTRLMYFDLMKLVE